MSKRKSPPKGTITVTPARDDKPKRRRGCMRYVWIVLLGCGLVFYALVSPPSPSTPSTPTRNAAETTLAISRANRTATFSPLPTNRSPAVAQQSTPVPTVNITGTASAIQESTNAAAATERAINNAAVLTQAAASITPSPTATRTTQPTSAPPTQALPETWYTTADARARACPQLDCDIVTVLNSGTRVEVIGLEHGASVNGNTVWRLVLAGGQITYVHSSLLSQTAPRPTSPPVQAQPVTGQQSQPISTPVPAVPQPASPEFTCNCSKTCEQMVSCEEAYFQLNQCGCRRRDADNDGVPCENMCPGG